MMGTNILTDCMPFLSLILMVSKHCWMSADICQLPASSTFTISMCVGWCSAINDCELMHSQTHTEIISRSLTVTNMQTGQNAQHIALITFHHFLMDILCSECQWSVKLCSITETIWTQIVKARLRRFSAVVASFVVQTKLLNVEPG